MKRVLSSTARPSTWSRCRRFLSNNSRGSSEQAVPLGKYYENILDSPPFRPEPDAPPASSTDTETPEPAPSAPPDPLKPSLGRKPKADKPSPPGKSQTSAKATSPSPSKATSPPIPTPPPSNVQAQARVIFGSRLLGPAEQAERLAGIRDRSTLIAGVLVPPRPEEPDNCCMSGCVNCVWDRYRDDMELWASSRTEAERRLKAQEAGTAGAAAMAPPAGVGRARPLDPSALSMDDDGGGSESNWDALKQGTKIAKDLWDDELYKNIPVGIREFMKQEKRLKLKHEREGTLGG